MENIKQWDNVILRLYIPLNYILTINFYSIFHPKDVFKSSLKGMDFIDRESNYT